MGYDDRGVFALDAHQVDVLADKIQAYGDGAVDHLDSVIKTQVAPMISDSIEKLMPQSGRRFKGHASGAKGSAWPLHRKLGRLSVEVTTIKKRRYLYFPDDGSNTRHHAGMQNFFGRGMDAVLPQAIDVCMDSLTKGLEC